MPAGHDDGGQEPLRPLHHQTHAPQLVPVHPLVGAKGLATAGRIRTMVGWHPRSRRGLAWVAVGLNARLLLASFLAAFVLRKYTDTVPAAGSPFELQSYAYAVLVAA